MFKYSLALILSFLLPVEVSAQRHGRADAVQNYIRGTPSPSELLLQIRIQEMRLYFRRSDLRKIPRTVITVSDPINGTSHTYVGVDLEDLIPKTVSRTGSEVIEVSFGSNGTMRIVRRDQGPAPKVLVVDTVDGREVSGFAPYDVFARIHQGNLELIENVKQISVKSEH